MDLMKKILLRTTMFFVFSISESSARSKVKENKTILNLERRTISLMRFSTNENKDNVHEACLYYKATNYKLALKSSVYDLSRSKRFLPRSNRLP